MTLCMGIGRGTCHRSLALRPRVHHRFLSSAAFILLPLGITIGFCKFEIEDAQIRSKSIISFVPIFTYSNRETV